MARLNIFHHILIFIILLASSTLWKVVHAQDGDGEETDDGDMTVISCYECDSTDECAMDQDRNSSSVECADGDHCWTWKTEVHGNATYKRGCSDACTKDSLEVVCQTSNNLTDCTICCSEDFCNFGPVNGGNMQLLNATWWLMVFMLTLFIAGPENQECLK